jgi:Leucine Rich repeat
LDISNNYISSIGLDDIIRILESTRLKKISLAENYTSFVIEASKQRFARVLSRHEFLKELDISRCLLGDGGIRLLADGLHGNTSMEDLNIGGNDITPVGLHDITRMIESTQLKTIRFGQGVFYNADATQRFVSTLQHKKSSVQELPGITPDFPNSITASMYATITNSLIRNQQLNRVNLLLAPLTLQHHHQPPTGTTTFWIKTCHKAIAKFANKVIPNNAGASAIFKLFQARPQLLEKRLKRSSAATGSNRDSSSRNAGNTDSNKRGGGGGGDNVCAMSSSLGGQKRQRL